MMHVDKESGDLALAAALADEYSARLQFLGDRRVWLAYTPQSGLWSKHEADVAVQAAAAAVIGRAGLVVQEHKIRRVIKVAQFLPEFHTGMETFDQHPEALTLVSGVLDTRDGHMEPHSPSNRSTRSAAVGYVPGGAARVQELVMEMMSGDAERAALLRRVCAYCLTGLTNERVFFIAYGPTRSGKSSLFGTLAAALGTYALSVDPSLFMQRRKAEAVYSTADLPARRLALSSEAGKGDWLDASVVKRMTDDNISARRPGEQAFVFNPQFKAVILTNSLPRGMGADQALQRRLVPLHFGRTFPVDQALEAWWASRAGQEAVLAWAMAALGELATGGLAVPARVVREREALAVEEDAFGRFLAEDQTRGAGVGAEVRGRHAMWAALNGEKAMSMTAFGIEMRERGFEHHQVQTDGKRQWLYARPLAGQPALSNGRTPGS